jgi:VanZ family protein
MDQKKFLNFYKFLFLIWFLFILVVSIYPGNLIGLVLKGDPTTYPGGDKVSHFISYFLLGSLAFFSFEKNKKFKNIVFFLILFSLIMEFLHLFIPNRFYENLDLVMNFLGIIIGLSIFQLKNIKN